MLIVSFLERCSFHGPLDVVHKWCLYCRHQNLRPWCNRKDSTCSWDLPCGSRTTSTTWLLIKREKLLNFSPLVWWRHNGGKSTWETDHDKSWYMSNLEAKKAVWISPRFGNARAIDWLNGPLTTSFYLVKWIIELWAPQLRSSKGQEEVKQLGSERRPTPCHQERELFWTTFIDHMKPRTTCSNIAPFVKCSLMMGMTGVGLHIAPRNMSARNTCPRETRIQQTDLISTQSIESAFVRVWERLDRGIHTRINWWLKEDYRASWNFNRQRDSTWASTETHQTIQIDEHFSHDDNEQSKKRLKNLLRYNVEVGEFKKRMRLMDEN